MRQDEYVQMMAAGMKERQLQDAVVGLARRAGWLVYHTYDSRRSDAGWPDLVLVHPVRRRLLIRELKTMKGRVSPAQKIWLAALEAVGVDVAVWRPDQWHDRTIEKELVA